MSSPKTNLTLFFLLGSVTVNSSSTAYVGQQPWIQNMTVKQNILFGQDMNEGDEAREWYDWVRRWIKRRYLIQ